jgi:hypothetical protein
MLQYAIDARFIKFLSSLTQKEKGEALWLAQACLSHAPGYLRQKKAEINDDVSIYGTPDGLFILFYDDYAARVLLDGVSSPNGDYSSLSYDGARDPVASISIADIVKVRPPFHYQDELTSFLSKNYFTNWMIALLDLLSPEERALLLSPKKAPEKPKEPEAPAKEAKQPEAKPVKEQPKEEPKPAEKHQESAKPAEKPRQPKKNVDGAAYERAILESLAESYRKRQEAKSKLGIQPKRKPLHHVRFADREVVISYDSEEECLRLLQKRTRKYGLRTSNTGWLIILANTVPENFADTIESYYPNHVVYTDDQNKGELEFGIIVKKNRSQPKPTDEEDLGVRKVKSKRAAFNKQMPSGAFTNIDDEENELNEEDYSYDGFAGAHHGSEIRRVKDKRASFTPTLPEQPEIEDEFEYFDFDEDLSEEEPIEENEPQESHTLPETPNYPAHWHCYLCGKKKLYTGVPARTVTLSNGKTVYLCNKHKDNL